MRPTDKKKILTLLRQRKPRLYEDIRITGASTDELLFRFQLENPELYNELLEEVVGEEEARYRSELV